MHNHGKLTVYGRGAMQLLTAYTRLLLSVTAAGLHPHQL